LVTIVASLINGVCGVLRIFATDNDRSAPFVTRGRLRPSTVDTSPALLTLRQLLTGKAAKIWTLMFSLRAESLIRPAICGSVEHLVAIFQVVS